MNFEKLLLLDPRVEIAFFRKRKSSPVQAARGPLQPINPIHESSKKPASSANKIERPTRIRWLVLALASSTSLILYLHRFTWSIIRPQLEQEYKFSNTELELIFTSFNLSYAIGIIPGGIAADLFGAHIFLSSTILIWSAAVIGFALVGSFWAFIAFRVLFGAAQAGTYPTLAGVTRSWFPPSSRTTMQGFIASLAGRVGGALAPIVMATLLMGYYGFSWRTALMIMALCGMVFAAVFYLFFRNHPEEDERVNQEERDIILEGVEPVKSKHKILRFSKALKNRSYQFLIFQQFSNAGADIVYTSVLGSFFFSKNISLGEMGVYASLPLFGGALGGFAGGILNDLSIKLLGNRRWARSAMGFLGKTIAAICLIFFFVLTPQTEASTLAWCLFVVKFFSDWSQPTVLGACTDMGGSHASTTFGIVNTSGNVGALVVPLFIGPLLDYYSTFELVNGTQERMTNYNPMFIMVAALYMVSAISWFFIDCTKPVDPEDA